MASKKRCERAFGVLRPYGVNPLDIYHQRVARLDSIHKHRTAYRIGPTDLQAAAGGSVGRGLALASPRRFHLLSLVSITNFSRGSTTSLRCAPNSVTVDFSRAIGLRTEDVRSGAIRRHNFAGSGKTECCLTHTCV